MPSVLRRPGRILLCARESAERALIAAAVHARGGDAVVFDPSRYPGATPLTHAIAREPAGIAAIWSDLVVGTDLPPMDPGERETCVAAATMAAAGWLDTIGAYHLDPYWARQRADNKPYQLRVARDVGLDVPPTIVSNEPDAVRAFAKTSGPIVAKMLVQPRGGGSDGTAGIVFTTAMTDADLDDLSGLELCPMIFQQRVPNDGDIRATVVGDRVIVALLDARPDDPDWRRDSYAYDDVPTWSAHTLPDEIVSRLLALTARLGLGYGAADLVRRPDGTYAFLELNASGSFAFLGDAIAGRIADAIADTLLGSASRRGTS